MFLKEPHISFWPKHTRSLQPSPKRNIVQREISKNFPKNYTSFCPSDCPPLKTPLNFYILSQQIPSYQILLSYLM